MGMVKNILWFVKTKTLSIQLEVMQQLSKN